MSELNLDDDDDYIELKQFCDCLAYHDTRFYSIQWHFQAPHRVVLLSAHAAQQVMYNSCKYDPRVSW